MEPWNDTGPAARNRQVLSAQPEPSPTLEKGKPLIITDTKARQIDCRAEATASSQA